jgi:hypothetical protein
MTPVVPAQPGPATDGGGAGGAEVPPTDDEPGGSKLPWVIAAVLVLIALVVGALLATRDDDGEREVGLEPVPGESTTTSTTSTSTTSTTTAPPETTTTAPPTTTTTEAPPVTIPPDQCAEAGDDPEAPEPAAEMVFEAWTLGDEDCAAELMTPAARVELFSLDGTDATDQFQGCFEVDDPDPAIDCAFTYEGGSTHYLMNFGDTDGWTVFDVFQVAD